MTPDAEPAAFGTSFEEALSAAFADTGVKLEPSNPKPDYGKEEEDDEEEVKEPEKKEEEKTPETLDDLDDKEADDLKLPIDEDTPEKEEEPDTTGMSKAAGERFKQLRVEQKELKKQLSTIEQEKTQLASRIKELEANTGTTEEVQKKLSEYELQLSISKLEATDAYKTAVTKPLSDIAETATSIAERHELDVNKLLDAIALSDQKAQDTALEDMLVGINERDKLKIYALAEKLPAVMAERDRLYENRDAALKEIDARKSEEDQKTVAERAKERKVALDLVETRVTTKIPFLKDSDKFNITAAKEAIADVDFSALDTTTAAYNAFAGRLLPQFAKAQNDLMKEIETLSDELDKYRKTSPTAKGTKGAPAASDDDGATFAQRVERALAGV
jgi:hypothetical protein